MIQNNSSVEIKLNTITLEDFLSIHFLCDADFDPPLSMIVDIKSYCLKVYQKAEIIAAVIDNKIVGIIAIYCNDRQSNIAYISSVCVIPSFRGKGIAKMMLKKADEIARLKQMTLIRLEVGINNEKAVNLYSQNGFVFESNGEYSIFMKKLLNE
jgi:ribosomal protein S18 acetylase RimI-like enzyme